jgi:hypothetical protein
MSVEGLGIQAEISKKKGGVQGSQFHMRLQLSRRRVA